MHLGKGGVNTASASLEAVVSDTVNESRESVISVCSRYVAVINRHNTV